MSNLTYSELYKEKYFKFTLAHQLSLAHALALVLSLSRSRSA